MELNISSLPNNSQNVRAVQQRSQVINEDNMKAILYLGIRGDILLPVEKHKVDTFA
ncbi:MAG: hypothetical protein ACLFR1_08780 [Spirochaetia bacterium]